jgi:hypothetical protein
VVGKKRVLMLGAVSASGVLILLRDGCDPAGDHVLTRPVHHGGVNYETGRATEVDPCNVETRYDLALFLSAVLADFRSTGQAEWENGTWIGSSTGWRRSRMPEPANRPSLIRSKRPGDCLPRSFGQQPDMSNARSFAADRARPA